MLDDGTKPNQKSEGHVATKVHPRYTRRGTDNSRFDSRPPRALALDMEEDADYEALNHDEVAKDAIEVP